MLLLGDSPRSDSDVPVCLARQQKFGAGTCSTARERAIDSTMVRAERQATAGLPGVSLLDLSDEICGADTCEPVRDGVIVYRDTNHLSVDFAERLAPVLAARMAPILNSARPDIRASAAGREVPGNQDGARIAAPQVLSLSTSPLMLPCRSP